MVTAKMPDGIGEGRGQGRKKLRILLLLNGSYQGGRGKLFQFKKIESLFLGDRGFRKGEYIKSSQEGRHSQGLRASFKDMNYFREGGSH